MAVAVQTGNIASYDGAPNTSHNLSVTVSSGSDLAVFLVVSSTNYRISNHPAGGYFQTPTFDGNSMTSVATIDDVANNTSHIYRIVGVSAGTYTLVISVSVYGGAAFVCTAVPMSGVDQTTPTGTAALYSTGGSASPQSTACTVSSGGIAIAGHGINATTQSITAGAGQTNLRAAVVQSGSEFLHTYKADATAMGYSWTATSPQNHQVIVPINPSAGGGGGGTTPLGIITPNQGIAFASAARRSI